LRCGSIPNIPLPQQKIACVESRLSIHWPDEWSE